MSAAPSMRARTRVFANALCLIMMRPLFLTLDVFARGRVVFHDGAAVDLEVAARRYAFEHRGGRAAVAAVVRRGPHRDFFIGGGGQLVQVLAVMNCAELAQ